MKKLIAVFLLSTYLFSATDLKELPKTNVVVEHFYETKQTDKSVSFLHFLAMHYITDDHNNKDNNRDSQLPFKSHDACITGNSLVFVHHQFASFTFQPVLADERDFLIKDDSFVAHGHHTLVWHPPQFS